MEHGHDLSGIMKFATSPAWEEHLSLVLAEHLGPAMEKFGFEDNELTDILGDHWDFVLWNCALEDLMTRAVGPDGLNIVDEYIRRRGWNESGPTKLYMRTLRSSMTSLYEISEVEAGIGFLARDLIRGGEPVRVSEQSASQTLKTWDRIGVRIVFVGGKHLLSGGVLPFNIKAADTLIATLRRAEGKRDPRAILALDDDKLRALPALFSTTWLLDVLPLAMGRTPEPALHNSDGDEILFHRLRFPFARGATHALVAERLDTLAALQRETTHCWIWLGEKPVLEAKSGSGAVVWGLTMLDGTPVLGNVELKGRALILEVTSAKRAMRATSLVTDTLAGLVGAPTTTVQTVDEAIAALRDQSHKSATAIAPEIATPLIHAELDRSYRATLDTPVAMLGDVTPRAAASTAAGRERLSAWLKYLENLSDNQPDPNNPIATYDFGWLWRELGIEKLRR